MPMVSKVRPVPLRMAPRKRVAAYARVSVDTEALLHSLSAQVSYYSKLIQANPEWEYAGVYADEGVTGTSTAHRAEFNRLIADCEADRINIVLTKSISRFARDTVDCLNTIRRLKDIGVEVRFEREGISTFSTDGELLLTLLASFAQAESESISSNIKWATRKRFEEGIPNGHKAPYGYEWDGEMFRIIPEQGETVKFIFRQYLAGEPAYSIAKTLTARGITGQNGLPMRDFTVKDIISNISYTGTMVLQKNYMTDRHVRKRNKGELPRYAVEDMFEPLVSMEDYEQAQAMRRQRAEEAPNACIIPTKFSGLVKCGNCGFCVSRRSFKNAKRWVCNARERRGLEACDMRPVMETELEAASSRALGDLDDEEFKRTIRQITIYGDRIEFLLADGKAKSAAREYGGYKARNGFSGRLFCGECGCKLGRDTIVSRKGGQASKTISWGCTGPRSSCALRRLPEEELRRAAASILGADGYEPAFVEKVQRAVAGNSSIRFEFKDGTVETWQRE